MYDDKQNEKYMVKQLNNQNPVNNNNAGGGGGGAGGLQTQLHPTTGLPVSTLNWAR